MFFCISNGYEIQNSAAACRQHTSSLFDVSVVNDSILCRAKAYFADSSMTSSTTLIFITSLTFDEIFFDSDSPVWMLLCLIRIGVLTTFATRTPNTTGAKLFKFKCSVQNAITLWQGYAMQNEAQYADIPPFANLPKVTERERSLFCLNVSRGELNA